MSFLSKLFDTGDFVPRWSCGNWSQGLAWTHMVSDFLIFISYAAIPAALGVVVARRRDLPHARIWLLFVAFILSCGVTHLVEAGMFYFPVYRLSGLLKAVTAVISIVTAVTLAFALPTILSLPGLQRLNERLTDALASQKDLSAQLADARDNLEERAAAMTVRARRFGEALASSGAVACRWEAETGRIDWEMGFADAMRSLGGTVARTMNNWAETIGPEAAERLREASLRAIQTQSHFDIETPLAVMPGYNLRISARPEARVAGQPAHVMGMFRFSGPLRD